MRRCAKLLCPTVLSRWWPLCNVASAARCRLCNYQLGTRGDATAMHTSCLLYQVNHDNTPAMPCTPTSVVEPVTPAPHNKQLSVFSWPCHGPLTNPTVVHPLIHSANMHLVVPQNKFTSGTPPPSPDTCPLHPAAQPPAQEGLPSPSPRIHALSMLHRPALPS
jgi:hypothetical protein